jgi:hypothetical protein
LPRQPKRSNTSRQTVDMGLGQAENNPTEIPLTTRGKQGIWEMSVKTIRS